MTCIVGLVDKDTIYMGGDSAGTSEDFSRSIRSDKKVFINGQFIMGFTTSFRMGQLLAYKFSPPKHHTDEDIMAFMVNDFIDGVRKCLKDGGFASKDKDSEVGGIFLVGYKGRLFTIYGDYQVAENLDGYAACGCGGDLALGSLHESQGKKDPDERIRSALEAATKFSAGVAPPYTILTL